MPRGPGKSSNYNLDYSRFNFLDKDEEQAHMVAAAREHETRRVEADAAAGSGPEIPPFREMLREMPVELQQAYHLMEVAKRDNDPKAEKLATEMALKAVEKGGPQVRQDFMKNVAQMRPDAVKDIDEQLNGGGASPVNDDMPVDQKIDTLRAEMLKGQEATRKQMQALNEQQDRLERLKSPEDILKFMTEGGMTEADLQRMFSGDTAHMEKCMSGMMDNELDKQATSDPSISTKAAEKAVKATEVLHDTLCGNLNPDEADEAIANLGKETPVTDTTGSSAKAEKEAPKKKKKAPEPQGRVVTIPDYRLQYQKDDDGRYTGVELKATLPGVSDMSMIVLDISADHLRLSTLEPAPGYVVNAGPFPVAIDHENARAKYSKKREELSITVPAMTS